jgi:DNA-binding NtrC family response regulator
MSKRILVVEDQEDNRQIIRDMLSATDYEITEAENGEEALAEVARQRPDDNNLRDAAITISRAKSPTLPKRSEAPHEPGMHSSAPNPVRY